jgi:hypothetical protein
MTIAVPIRVAVVPLHIHDHGLPSSLHHQYHSQWSIMRTLTLTLTLTIVTLLITMLSSQPLFVHGHSDATNNAAGFLFDHTHDTFSLPMDLHVALIGLHGNGGKRVTLNAMDFEQSLMYSLEAIRSTCMDTGHLLDVQYDMAYHVHHAASLTLQEIERLLHDHMTFAGTNDDGQLLFDVEVTGLEERLEQLYNAELAPLRRGGGGGGYNQRRVHDNEDAMGRATSDRAPASSPPYTIIIMNPDKERMRPNTSALASVFDSATTTRDAATNTATVGTPVGGGADAGVRQGTAGFAQRVAQQIESRPPYIYRYRYNDGSPASVFIGRGRFVVIDLAAGPVSFGVTNRGDGTVSAASLPTISLRPHNIEVDNDEDNLDINDLRTSPPLSYH